MSQFRPYGACHALHFEVVKHKRSCKCRKIHLSSAGMLPKLSWFLHDYKLPQNISTRVRIGILEERNLGSSIMISENHDVVNTWQVSLLVKEDEGKADVKESAELGTKVDDHPSQKLANELLHIMQNMVLISAEIFTAFRAEEC